MPSSEKSMCQRSDHRNGRLEAESYPVGREILLRRTNAHAGYNDLPYEWSRRSLEELILRDRLLDVPRWAEATECMFTAFQQRVDTFPWKEIVLLGRRTAIPSYRMVRIKRRLKEPGSHANRPHTLDNDARHDLTPLHDDHQVRSAWQAFAAASSAIVHDEGLLPLWGWQKPYSKLHSAPPTLTEASPHCSRAAALLGEVRTCFPTSFGGQA